MEAVSIIINPAAAGGSCMEKYARAKAVLLEHDVQITESFSRHPGQICALTQEAVRGGAKTVILAGGDGTLREAISALVYTDVNLALFPFGTGNDFAKFIGIAQEPQAAAEQFLKGSPRLVDAAMANDSYFMNVAGLGFDVEVLQRTQRFKKRFRNGSAYHLGLISALVNLRNWPVTIKTQRGTWRKNVIVISVGNGEYIGGGIDALPQADLQDGQLDVCVMHDVRLYRIPSVLMKFMKGEHLGLPETDYDKVDRLTVESEFPMAVQLDGEIMEETPVTFQILPKAIRMIL